MALEDTTNTCGVFQMTEDKYFSNKSTFLGSYHLGRELGTGAYSQVKTAIDKKDGTSYAVKIVAKEDLTPHDAQGLMDEIAILEEIKHPNIVQLYNVYDEPGTSFLVMEYMDGGELFDRIVQKQYYNEKEARDVCKILFETIHYCHKQKIVHRDVKPENLLLTSKDNDFDLKIADFGFAKKFVLDNSLTTQLGTPGYVAPEILRGDPYGTKVDMWSLGVIIYTLLGGYPPFMEEKQSCLFDSIKEANYEFHEEYWSGVSTEAQDLISKLLCKAPVLRFSAKDALYSSWMHGEDSMFDASDLASNLEMFRKFNAKRRLRGAVFALIATNKLATLTSPEQRLLRY